MFVGSCGGHVVDDGGSGGGAGNGVIRSWLLSFSQLSAVTIHYMVCGPDKDMI